MNSALSGIKVLDLAGYGPTSLASMLLGDMGADVVRIELPPDSGSRGVGDGGKYGPEGQDAKDKLAASMPQTRNKRSLALNLRMDAGQRVFHKLVKSSDVVVEAFRPGVMDRMNVGYEALRKTNPKIVYCAVTGYGQTGPYRSLAGHDANFVSMGGVQALLGDRPDGPPGFALNVVADLTVGYVQAVVGILLALLARERTSRGQLVDISMTDGVISLLAGIPGAMEYLSTGVLPRRGETLATGNLPYYTVYKTKDGKWLTLCPFEPKFWSNLCRATGRDDLLPHQWAPDKKDFLLAELKKLFLSKTRDEWFDTLSRADVPVGKVLELNELVSDPQVIHREMILDVDHPDLGKIRQFGFGIKLSGTPASVRRLGVGLGHDTNEVLREAGYSKSEIDDLRRQRVIY